MPFGFDKGTVLCVERSDHESYQSSENNRVEDQTNLHCYKKNRP